MRFIANTMIGSVWSIVKYFCLENIFTVIISRVRCTETNLCQF